jgi:transposase
MNPTKLPFPRDLLPDIPGLVLEDAHYVDHEMIVVLKSTAPAVVCPLCRTPSTRIHSRYRRAPTDLPWGGHTVRLVRANPGIEIISRDRSETYATGARQGAPEATQVADRWHLLHNWREAVERVFDRYRGRIKQLILLTQEPTDKPAAAVLPAKSVNRRRKYLEEQRARSQAKRLARYKVIRERHAKGEYLTTIARDLQIDYKTARKYALSDECPTRKPHPRRRRILEPYEPYLRARWAEECKNGRGLYREIVAYGYPGSRTQVATFVAQLRRQERGRKPQMPTTAAGEALTPHTASMLLMRRPERCGEAEHATIAQLREVHQDIGVAVSFTERFVEIVRERQGIKLSKWLSDAQASGNREIQQFAYKVRRDEAAVEAGCTLPWSNGQTEGQITKLKAIKRSMYGRAKFDLLRRRALHAA